MFTEKHLFSVLILEIYNSIVYYIELYLLLLYYVFYHRFMYFKNDH
jgi:hypothetical protein